MAWLVVLEDSRINQDILLAGPPGKAGSGQVVSVELVGAADQVLTSNWQDRKVLGEIDDPGIEIEIAVRKFACRMNFLTAQKAAAKLPSEVGDADLIDRVDLRDIPLVTIDGEDARDFDDAAYCTPVKIGRAKSLPFWWRSPMSVTMVKPE